MDTLRRVSQPKPRLASAPSFGVVLLGDVDWYPSPVGYLKTPTFGPVADGLVLGAIGTSRGASGTATAGHHDVSPADTAGVCDGHWEGGTPRLCGLCICIDLGVGALSAAP